jgi:hypothetical protein
VIAVAVRWYLRYSLSHRDVEELPVERGVAVDCVQAFTSQFRQTNVRTPCGAGRAAGQPRHVVEHAATSSRPITAGSKLGCVRCVG